MLENCICAAIKLPTGEIIRGFRHNNCLDVVRKDIAIEPNMLQKEAMRVALCHATSGFITNKERFVTRAEGLALQKAAGIPSARNDGVYKSSDLFSEDLY